jgi:hypothetical protein
LTAPPIEVVGGAGWSFGDYGARQAGGKRNKPVRCGIWKISDEDAIGDGKNAGSRCASKREDEDGGRSESRGLQKSADSLAKLRSHDCD